MRHSTSKQMTDQPFNEFVAQAIEKLATKSQAVSNRILKELNNPPFEINTEKRLIEWTNSSTGDVVLAYRAIPIGSYNQGAGTFLWAWANSTVPGEPIEKLREVSRLAERFPDIPALTQASYIETPEQFAIDVTAAIVELYDAVSFYRYEEKTTKGDTVIPYFYLLAIED